MIVQHNMMAANAARMYKINSGSTSKTSEKLSSGYRVNRSADDAAGLSISEKMRRQIRGLSRASTNCQEGIALVQVADGALNEVLAMIQRENELMIQAANGTNGEADRQAIEDEIYALSDEMDRIFNTTKFNETYLFRGGSNEMPHVEPVVTDRYEEYVEEEYPVSTESVSEVVWFTPGSQDSNITNEINTADEVSIETITGSKLNAADFSIDDITTKYTKIHIVKGEEKIEYEDKSADLEYTALMLPGNKVSSNGYVNVSTRHNSLPLSCAISTLALRVNDAEVGGNDIMDARGIQFETERSADNRKTTTTYKIDNQLSIIQEVELVSADGSRDNAYKMTYKAKYTDNGDATADASKKVELKLAFDALNTTDGVEYAINDNVTKTFELETDDTKVKMTQENAIKGVLGSINKLDSEWDGSNITDGEAIGYSYYNHNGIAYWWESTLNEGDEVTLGSATYSVQLKKMPWIKTTSKTITENRLVKKVHEQTVTYSVKGEYNGIHIQAGTETLEFIHIQLMDMSTRMMNIKKGEGVSAFSAEKSIDNVRSALGLITSLRAYYGAIQNRLEHAYRANDNTVENTTASESRIRDTDMAAEMVKYSKDQILSNAGESMLAQANQSTQGVLALLQ